MKIISVVEDFGENENTIITLVPQTKDDLFTVYQIIDKEDEVIFKKLFTTKKDEVNRKTSTDLINLRLKILSYEFDIKEEYLRYKGVTVADDTNTANLDVPVGKFLSFSVTYEHQFTIFKHHFNKYAKRLLKEALELETKSDTAAVVLQEGISHVCLLTASSTILKQKIEISMPKKKDATDINKFNEKTEKFYRATYDAMMKNFNFDELRMIILCSPGFYAKALMERILKYAEKEQNNLILENQEMLIIAHCSTGYLQGITEVLRDPEYSTVLQNTKFIKEIQIMDDFFEHLNKDDNKAWYGEEEIKRAAKLDAIETLLITDSVLKSDDIDKRETFLDLTYNIEQSGGKVFVFSTLQSHGEELERLKGLACILKYPIPDLDEILENDKNIL
ncbi:hypothetical protein SUVZ_03G0620 [Saccharomyces uvarum]|uniref:Protein DOM34 homolog n=1 Tax=Saccharomyces uvarum TaxID=230603 RepID=A0ABN8WPR8_SACUV|nr:hypothetical protein SUVZ_03G0620 [Saccharomyces uvarum]